MSSGRRVTAAIAAHPPEATDPLSNDVTNESVEVAALRRREVAAFLSMLSGGGIDYCILHPFPERGFLSSTDLDLYIDGKRYPEAAEFLRANGWSEDLHCRFAAVRKYFSKVVAGVRLKLDIATEYAVFSERARFVYAGQVETRKGQDGYTYLGDVPGWFFILKKAAIKGGLSPDKLRSLKELAARTASIQQGLRSTPAEIGPECCRDSTIDERFVAIRTGRLSATRWLKLHARRFCLARGRFTVAFVGLDGSGKGTYLALLHRELESRNVSVKCVYLGYSGYRLAPLRHVAACLDRATGVRRKALTLAYLCFLPLDFLVRRGRGRYDVLLTDRHPLYEPIFRSGPLRWYDRMIVQLCPRPDLVICLSGDAHQLWARKKEGSLEQYIRRRERLAELIASRSVPETRVVETTDGVDEVFARIRDLVCENV